MKLREYIHNFEINYGLTLLTNIDITVKDFYDNYGRYKKRKITKDHCYEKCKNIIEKYREGKAKFRLSEEEYQDLIKYIAVRLSL